MTKCTSRVWRTRTHSGLSRPRHSTGLSDGSYLFLSTFRKACAQPTVRTLCGGTRSDIQCLHNCCVYAQQQNVIHVARGPFDIFQPAIAVAWHLAPSHASASVLTRLYCKYILFCNSTIIMAVLLLLKVQLSPGQGPSIYSVVQRCRDQHCIQLLGQTRQSRQWRQNCYVLGRQRPGHRQQDHLLRVTQDGLQNSQLLEKHRHKEGG